MQCDWFMYHLRSTYKNRLEFPFNISVFFFSFFFVQTIFEGKFTLQRTCYLHVFFSFNHFKNHTLKQKRVNNSLHLWSEEISLVKEWISLILTPVEWKCTSQRVKSCPVHSIFRQSDHWRHLIFGQAMEKVFGQLTLAPPPPPKRNSSLSPMAT